MPNVEREIAQYYTHGSLEDAILGLLRDFGRDEVSEDDLAGIDEFHMGGRRATRELAARLALSEHSHVLDIGCGIGGTARFLAGSHGCRVTGLDLTPEYVTVARRLTELVGLGGRVAFEVGSGAALPFEAGRFDAATLLHVGMNVPDKEALFAETARVLKPGGTFAVYDVMRVGPGELDFPVAWARAPETSFLEPPESYRRAAEAAGFTIVEERSRADMALEFFRRVTAMIAEQRLPPLGLHVLMGADASLKVANMLANIEAGRIAPVEMICRRSDVG